MVLKAEMGTAATANLPTGGEPRDQVQHMWTQWLRWATTNPEKRRALAHLEVAAEITAESHRTVSEAQKVMADVLERSRGEGPIKDTPPGVRLDAGGCAGGRDDPRTRRSRGLQQVRFRSDLASSCRHLT